MSLPMQQRPPAILVTSFPGDPGVGELARRARDGERPRRDYVELADRISGVVIDDEYMRTRASPVARLVARISLPAGQVVEAFVRRRSFGPLVAWADRLGLGLALLLKLARSRRRIVLISVLLSNPKKALPLKLLRLHTAFGAIITMGTVQLRIAADELGIPEEKLHFGPHPVDAAFWRATRPPDERRMICAVGLEARDYPTLFAAVDGLDVEVEAAVGSLTSPDAVGSDVPQFARGVPSNVRIRPNLRQPQLRELYERCRFVVIPLEDVDFDAGVTAITETMAMGRAVVVTRSRGQVDVVRDGENGVYVPPADPAALRAAIERLLDSPAEAERLGSAGRALVEQRHSLDVFVEQVAGLVPRT